MQKCQNLYLTPFRTSQFGGCPSTSGRPVIKKFIITKSSSILILWGSILCQKCKIQKFQRPSIIGAPRPPGVASDQKVAIYNMFLEFNCKGGLFYVKTANSKKNFVRQVPTHSDPKILFPRFFSPGSKVPKQVCHTPVGQKLREEIDFLKTGCFWPRAIHTLEAHLTPRP